MQPPRLDTMGAIIFIMCSRRALLETYLTISES